jgi:hypothetical protein
VELAKQLAKQSMSAQRTAPLGCDFLFLPFNLALLFSLFKNDVLAELFGVLFELYLAGNELFVFARPIHLPRGGVLEYDKLVL